VSGSSPTFGGRPPQVRRDVLDLERSAKRHGPGRSVLRQVLGDRPLDGFALRDAGMPGEERFKQVIGPVHMPVSFTRAMLHAHDLAHTREVSGLGDR